jgi:hypothetical protein
MKPKMVRTERTWVPQNLLCKRFNIANPYPDGVPTIQQSVTRLQRVTQAVEKEAVVLDQLKRLRNKYHPAPEFSEQKSSTVPEMAPKIEEADKSHKKEGEEKAETVPSNEIARPSMDIFKAIFEADSDSEEEEEGEKPLALPITEEATSTQRAAVTAAKISGTSGYKAESTTFSGESEGLEQQQFFGPQRPPNAQCKSSSLSFVSLFVVTEKRDGK